MAKRGILNTTQKTVVKAAKASAEGVKDVATDAIGAAASAVARVVLGRVSELGSGRKADEAGTSPRKPSANTPRRKASQKNGMTKGRSATKARSGTKARTAAKRNAVKKRSIGKASRSKAVTAKGPDRKSGAKKKTVRGRRAR